MFRRFQELFLKVCHYCRHGYKIWNDNECIVANDTKVDLDGVLDYPFLMGFSRC